jgi:hypothetical protein
VTIAKEVAVAQAKPEGIIGKMTYALTYGTSVDVHQVVEEDEMVAAIHENAEVFDPKAEQAFAYLQVRGAPGEWCWAPGLQARSNAGLAAAPARPPPLWWLLARLLRAAGAALLSGRHPAPCAAQVFSAICVIFAHGSGEVGYMTGPLGAVWQVRRAAAAAAGQQS